MIEFPLTNIYLNDIVFTNQQTGYAVGDQGMILKTTNAGGAEIDTETPISKIISDVLLQIFPNPSTQSLTISTEVNQTVKLEIFDITGKLIKYKKICTNQIIDISSLSNGIYIIKIADETNNLFVDKLIKQ